MKLIEFESIEVLEDHLERGKKLENIVFQSVDLTDFTLELLSHPLKNCVFLGCRIDPGIVDEIIYKGALVFPQLEGIPYDAFRNSLYTPDELLDGLNTEDAGSIKEIFDAKIYRHFVDTGRTNPPSILETFARSLHDHSIEDSLEEYIADKKVAAVMGGHAVKRDDKEFLEVARLSKKLTEMGYVLASGGGPGAMEATHVGAWFANRSEKELNEGINYLSKAPDYKDKFNWTKYALDVKNKYPRIENDGKIPESLGIPTWLYGHEPPTIFATTIAKYFANSLREEGLLAISRSGVVFSPGSAGTLQEVFQDGAQNHYKTEGVVSPMIFFGKKFWTETLPAYELLKKVSKGRDYQNLILITDVIEEIADFINSNS